MDWEGAPQCKILLRLRENPIISVVRSRPEELQKLPDVGTSLNEDHVSKVSPLQQNTKKRCVMFDPIDDGEVEPTVADNMASFHDVLVMANYSLEGEKVVVRMFLLHHGRKNRLIWETTLKFSLHMGLHPQKEKVQKREAGASKWEVLDLEEAKPR